MSASLTTDFAESRATYEAALSSLFSGKAQDTEAELTKLFSPTFTLKADSLSLDFPAFVAHIRRLREIPLVVTLNITQFLRDGSQLAERHSSTTTLPDGSVRAAETFQFAEVAEDGRIAWIVESVHRFQQDKTLSGA